MQIEGLEMMTCVPDYVLKILNVVFIYEFNTTGSLNSVSSRVLVVFRLSEWQPPPAPTAHC